MEQEQFNELFSIMNKQNAPATNATSHNIKPDTGAIQGNIPERVVSSLKDNTQPTNTQPANAPVNIPVQQTTQKGGQPQPKPQVIPKQSNTAMPKPAIKKVVINETINTKSAPEKKEVSVSSSSAELEISADKTNEVIEQQTNTAIVTATVATAAITTTTGEYFDGYFTIFGIQLAKSSIFILVGFIIILALYYLYKYSYTKKEIVTAKRNQEVSYNEQQKMKDSCDEDEESEEEKKSEKPKKSADL